MKTLKILILMLVLVSTASQAFAYYDPFETTDHYNSRRSSERYQAYESNSNPLYQYQ